MGLRNIYFGLGLLLLVGGFLGYRAFQKTEEPEISQVSTDLQDFEPLPQADEDAENLELDEEASGEELLLEKEHLKDELDQSLSRQMEADYRDFFEGKSIPQEKRAELIKIFVENKTHQQDLLVLLLDQESSVPQVLAKQTELKQAQDQKESALLGQEDSKVLRDYESALPEKIYRRELRSLLEGLSIKPDELTSIENIFVKEELADEKEGKSLNLLEGRHTLDLESQHFELFKKVMESNQGEEDGFAQIQALEDDRRTRILSQIPEQHRQAIEERLKSKSKDWLLDSQS
jgi:hypothetical protein